MEVGCEEDRGLARLLSRVERERTLIVAFSGGADSALLAWAAHQALGARAVAVTAVSASMPAVERRAAERFTAAFGIPHLEVVTDELTRAEYRRNDGNRCFHCKSALFDALAPLVDAFGPKVALGTNVDDLADHRPGQQAAIHRGAIAPLVDAGLTKADVRRISARIGLPTSSKPAAACLASRVAYGDEVTAPLLARIERAEDLLHEYGFPECRVRAHAQGTVARVEVPVERLADLLARRAGVEAHLLRCGFTYVTVDLAGMRSGSMNALLAIYPVP